jgi:hypothetical protein
MLFVIAFGMAAAGCSSTGPDRASDQPPMPFHVLVVTPVSLFDEELAAQVLFDEELAAQVPGDDATVVEDETLTNMVYLADDDRLAGRLAERLDGAVFTQATVGRFDEESDGRPGPEGAVALGRDAGADLVLYCEVARRAPIHMERTSPVPLNVLLWLLGGPFIWTLDELTYSADAVVQTTLYDVEASTPASALSGATLARVADAPAAFEGVETDFIDREGWQGAGSIGSYFATIFTSTFAVAKENEHVEQVVTEEIERALVDGVIDGLERRRLELEGGRHMAGQAAIAVKEVAVTRLPGGEVVVDLAVLLGLQGQQTVMAGYRLQAGEQVLEQRFEAGEDVIDSFGRPSLRYRVAALLPDVPADIDTLRVTLVAGARDRVARSFTFRIDDGS